MIAIGDVIVEKSDIVAVRLIEMSDTIREEYSRIALYDVVFNSHGLNHVVGPVSLQWMTPDA